MLPGQITELILHLESEWHLIPVAGSSESHYHDNGHRLKDIHRFAHAGGQGMDRPHAAYHMNQNRQS